MDPAKTSEGVRPQTAARIAEAFGLTLIEGSLRRVSARVWRAQTPEGAVALKCFDDPRVAEVEAGLLGHLQGGGGGLYRVQELVRGPCGSPCLEVEGRRVMVTRWSEGEHRGYRDIDARGWAALGRGLAALHLRLDSAPRIAGLASLSEGLQGCSLEVERARIVRQRVDLEALGVSAAVLSCLEDRLVLLDDHLGPCLASWPAGASSPIHNDYNVHNFLFGRVGPPAILDWDRAVRAPRAYEVVRCLNHLPIEAPSLARAFAGAYLEVRPLDPEVLTWAVHAALVSHGLKHWPVELMLEGAEGAGDRLIATGEVVRALAEGRGALFWFFEQVVRRL